MTADAVRCPDCDSPVPLGRLSCASCGALLASVTGAGRPAFVAASIAASGEAAEFDESLPIGGGSGLRGSTVPDSPRPHSPAPDSPWPDSTEDRPIDAQPTEPDPAGPPESASNERRTMDIEPDPAAGQAPVHQEANDAPASGTQAVAARTMSLPPARAADGRTSPVLPRADPGPRAGPDSIQGAYLPPSQIYRAPAPRPSPDRSPRSAPASTLLRSPEPPPPSPVPSLELDGSVVRRSVNWLVLVGCVVAAGSFLLPWATDGVIGASGSGYTSTWGLANPGYLLLMAASLSLLGLELLAVRVPAWIRQGILPLVVGCVLIGVVFVYDARPYGGGTGVSALAVGALLLFVGGLIGVRPGRAEPARPMPVR